MRILSLVVALALGSSVARADELPDRTERVFAAGKLWAEIKYFHPYLAYKAIDWDAAFVTALPKLEAATTKDAYKRALAEMLAKLGDPVTRIRDDAPAALAAPTGDWLTTPGPDVAVVDLGGFVAGGVDYVGWSAKAKRVSEAAAKAKVLVLDLRVGERDLTRQAVWFFKAALPAIDRWPLERTVEYHGFRAQDQAPAGAYYGQFATTGGKAPTTSTTSVVHVVVLADARSELPSELIGLQMSGRATLIAPAISEDSVVSTKEIEVVPGITAQLRLGELLSGPPVTDVRVPVAELRTRGLAIAKTKVAARGTTQPRPIVNLPPFQPRDDFDYADKPYPSRELRVLGGLRLWAVLDRFFPYRYLAGDWDKALRDALPKLEAAQDAGTYLDVLKELGARSGDGHVGVYEPTANASRTTVAVATRLVEGKLVVMRVLDTAEAKGLVPGDLIQSIDGKASATLLAEKRVLISGSTEEARDQRTAGAILYGPPGTSVKLGVRGADGKLREVVLNRRADLIELLRKPPATGPAWKKLPNNVGYVDLTRLMVPEVGPMFADLGSTKALVFDMRGYPNGTAWPIAPRINTRGAKYGAQFLRPYVMSLPANADTQDMRVRFLQPIPALPPGASIYKGKIVVLIDDRAISQSEHSCLFYQEAAGATFIGSPTHGANGDITRGRLPGGLRFMFTGQEVKHVDGKQLQRVGIQPHIAIRPTLAGVRAGKDELLDRALVFLTTGK